MSNEANANRELYRLLKKDNDRSKRRIAAGEERIRELEASTAGGGTVPEGHVLLTAAEAKAWADAKAGFTAVGLTPEAGIAAVAEVELMRSRLAEADAAVIVREAAELHGWSPKVLAGLLKLGRGVHLEMVEIDLAGEPTPVPHVRTADDAEPVRLDVYAKAEWEHYLPALQPSEEAPADRGQTRRHAGPSYPAQRAAGRSSATGPTPEQLAAAKRAQVGYGM